MRGAPRLAILLTAWFVACGQATEAPGSSRGEASSQAAPAAGVQPATPHEPATDATPAAPARLTGALAGRSCLLVVLDALQAAAIGCYGGDVEASSTIDALAAGGVRFTRAWSQASWTLPSTTSLLTGLYQETHGVAFGVGLEPIRLSDEATTLAELFGSAGYHTALWTENVFAGPDYGLDQGFDEVRGGRNGGVELVERAAAAISASTERPRFDYVHLRRPHSPFDAPAENLESFGVPGYSGSAAGTDEDITAHNRGERPLKGDDLSQHRALYLANLRQADAELRRLLAAVDFDETLVVLLSDHGEALGEHGLLGHNWRSYEEYVHIPFVLRQASLPAGLLLDAPVMTIDVLPTLADLFDLPAGRLPLQGRSLVPLLEGRGTPERPAVFSSSRVDNQGRQRLAVSDGQHKLIVTLPEGAAELFDLTADPGERHNLASDLPGVVERLRSLLAEWRGGQRARLAVPADQQLDAEALESLRRLGYIGDDDG